MISVFSRPDPRLLTHPSKSRSRRLFQALSDSTPHTPLSFDLAPIYSSSNLAKHTHSLALSLLQHKQTKKACLCKTYSSPAGPVSTATEPAPATTPTVPSTPSKTKAVPAPQPPAQRTLPTSYPCTTPPSRHLSPTSSTIPSSKRSTFTRKIPLHDQPNDPLRIRNGYPSWGKEDVGVLLGRRHKIRWIFMRGGWERMG